MISANEINALLEDYLNSASGKSFLKKQGVSVKIYDEVTLLKIAEDLKNEIINEFLRITKHASELSAKNYFSGVYVDISKKHNTKQAIINFIDTSLYRPSLYAPPSNKHPNGGFTGEGIRDIFALISNGTTYNTSRPAGYWTYNDQGSYGTNGAFAHALNPRKGKPFITNIIKKFETANPGLKITYPSEWR